jgi:AraC family transcriptional regulator of adaptative response/methylated-DNA-[protein]-cysteine methyltransferase
MNILAANKFVTQDSLEAAEAIQFAVAGCDVGKVLVARSRIGVCAILLSTKTEQLETELDKIFPSHVLVRNERAVKEDMFKVQRVLASPNAGLNIPLDIRGTPFQRKVWEALRTIQAGRPLTFTQLACRIPGSKSLRAIGQACAENPIALAIPCHRVMGNSGSLLNYRYGAPCKRSLINRELAIT